MEETETTNKVLETKIDGLKELTDTRFKNITEALTRIELANTNFVSRKELDEVKTNLSNVTKSNEDNKDAIKLWRGISIGISLIGGPIVTVLIGLVIYYLTNHKG